LFYPSADILVRRVASIVARCFIISFRSSLSPPSRSGYCPKWAPPSRCGGSRVSRPNARSARVL